jgi:hypothetical protein
MLHVTGHLRLQLNFKSSGPHVNIIVRRQGEGWVASAEEFSMAAQIGESDIRAFEQAIGARLPDEYRNFLLERNGGKVKPPWFSIPNSNWRGNRGRVHYFFSICDDSTLSLLDAWETHRGRVPDELLPVGTDPGGDLLCIGLCGENAGAMFLWDRSDEVPDGEPPDYRNVFRLAPSFSSFMSSLSERE